MFKNYIKTAIRNLMRNKLHTIINISGLSIGIAVSILILSYVWFELSFDRFHSKFDQIYRVVISLNKYEETVNRATVGPALASALKEEFPEIQHVTTMYGDPRFVEIEYEDKKVPVEKANIVWITGDLFQIFDIELVQGDPETALQERESVILTVEMAETIFGKENPIGKSITSIRGDWISHHIVTGVAKSMPANSHFNYKILISRPFLNQNGFEFPYTNTYITLPKNYPAVQLEQKFPDFVRKYVAPEIENGMNISYDEFLKSGGHWYVKLLPLKKVHLDNTFKELNNDNASIIKKGNEFQVRMYTIVAILIILLACINFITLSTAKSETRAKEVGIRKVTGAKREQLIRQFLAESLLLSIISLVVAIILISVFSGPYNNLLGIQTANSLSGKIIIIILLLFITLFAGILAGSYPAFFLSSFRPTAVLYGRIRARMKGMNIRNGLVIFQFVISIVLITASIVVYKQYSYMQNKYLGFDKENIVIIKNLSKSFLEVNDTLIRKQNYLRIIALKQEILKNPTVVDASVTGVFPGKWGIWGSGQGGWQVRSEGPDPERFERLFSTRIDDSYINVFGLELAAGSNLKEFHTFPDYWDGVLINERAVELLGLKDPIGKYIYPKDYYHGGQSSKTTLPGVPIIGVLKDFHNQSLYGVINPYIFFPPSKISFEVNYLSVKFLPGNIPENISFLQKTWEEFAPDQPFEFSFFDQEFENMYLKEKKLARIFTFFCILAVFIGCLGMFGLASLTAEQRTKEIGIRKVNGALISTIILRIGSSFIKLVVIAFVIATPLAWYLMHRWLETFLFRTKLSWWIFALAGALALFIALLTVSGLSWRAATRNPVEALRYE